MRSALLFVAGACALGACARAPVAPSAAPQQAPAHAMHFLAGPNVARAEVTVEPVGDWACEGDLVVAHVTRIPDDASVLETDAIHEISPEGRLLATWRVPVEARPMAVTGDRLTVVDLLAEHNAAFAIDPAGNIDSAPMVDPAPESFVECPAMALPDSDYRRCARLVDATTNSSRLFTFEGPCT